MWKDHKTLNRIPESISGMSIDGDHKPYPYYVRYNGLMKEDSALEYSTEKPEKGKIPEELYQTSAGRIEMYDEGEFGGCLKIGGRHICNGNFSTIFEYNGEKYVVDNLAHMGTHRFGLIRVNDDGTTEMIYRTDDNNPFGYFFSSGGAMAAYYIGESIIGTEAVFFLCTGYENPGFTWPEDDKEKNKTDLFERNKKFQRIRFLLIFDSHREKEKQFIRINLPDSLEFSYVNSIWSDGVMLAIGCDKEVIMVHLPDMDIEYWTGLDKDLVERLLKKKHRRWDIWETQRVHG